VPFELTKDLVIRVPTAPLFLATKMEAWRDRGADDPLGSHDLEDVIALVAGREELAAEMARASPEVRDWIGEVTEDLLAHPYLSYAITGALPDASRAPGYTDLVRERFALLMGTRS